MAFDPTLGITSTGYGTRANTQVAKPASSVANDLIVIGLYIDDMSGAGPTVTLPTGFTLLADTNQSGRMRLLTCYRVLTSADDGTTNFVFTHTSANTSCRAYRVSGTSITTSGSATTRSDASQETTITHNSVTTDAANTILIGFNGYYAASARTPSGSPALVERQDDAGDGIWIGSELVSASGATGDRTCTVGSNNDWIAHMFAFKEGGGASPQTISPTAVASSLAFGTTKLNPIIFPGARASSLAFGTAKLNPIVKPAAIASGLVINNPTLLPGVATISPDARASSLTFGTLKMLATIAPSSRESSLSFGTLSVIATISPASLASSLTIGSPSIGLIIIPSSVASTLAFGTTKVNFTIFPASRASDLSFGTLSFVTGDTIAPGGVGSGLTFGTPKLNPTILIASRASTLSFGTLRLLANIVLSSRSSTLAIGSPVLTSMNSIVPTSIGSTLLFGTAKLNFRIFPASKTSGLTFGTLVIFVVGALPDLDPPFTVITERLILAVYTEPLARVVFTDNPIRLVEIDG